MICMRHIKFPFLFQLVELGATVIYSRGITTDKGLSVSSDISKHMPVLMFMKIKNKAGNNFILLHRRLFLNICV